MKVIYMSALILAVAVFLIVGFACLVVAGNFFEWYLAPIFALLAGVVHIGTMLLIEQMRPDRK